MTGLIFAVFCKSYYGGCCTQGASKWTRPKKYLDDATPCQESFQTEIYSNKTGSVNTISVCPMHTCTRSPLNNSQNAMCVSQALALQWIMRSRGQHTRSNRPRILLLPRSDNGRWRRPEYAFKRTEVGCTHGTD